jgi:hypothetical protein
LLLPVGRRDTDPGTENENKDFRKKQIVTIRSEGEEPKFEANQGIWITATSNFDRAIPLRAAKSQPRSRRIDSDTKFVQIPGHFSRIRHSPLL